MSHDTDKLIRQLSLVSYLMAERRPITARDVKQNVEGYSEMSDEAFARRFYSDRAELVALGVPLHSQRDEFTSEELYTLRSEQYFLPALELSDEELAALQTCFYLLEGKFAYAEPLRLALQNLALGRPGFADAPTATAVRVEVLDPDYSPEMPGRLGKLEGAISKQRTVKFDYWSIGRNKTAERTVNPYALLNDNGVWYVVAQDLDRKAMRTFRVARIRGDIRFATRRERDFRIPTDFDIDEFRGRPPWQVGEILGEARIDVIGDTAWWVERTYGEVGRVEDGVFVTPYSSIPLLASWVLRQDGRAIPLEPDELRREVADAVRKVRAAHEGALPRIAREAAVPVENGLGDRPAGPVVPERFAVLQALLAYLLAECGDQSSAEIQAHELVDRFHIPEDALEEHLSLLNLVNFGGGCYTVYAELRGDMVYVDKELYGETFRAAPRLTPLEARAIRLALEFVGPMIAADANTPLERVRRKLEETFGEFELAQTPEPHVDVAEEDLVGKLTDGIRERRLVEVEYLKEGEETPSTRLVEPYALERRLPYWYIHTWDRTADGERSFRLDRMRSARLTRDKFEPREGFEPRGLRDVRHARIWYSKAIARWRVERGDARSLADGAAISEAPVGSKEWLLGEIFSYRGEAVVLEPEDLRRDVAAHAKALAQELGVARLRARA
ncbi:MAG: proteasome accessory factor [Gaiellaceae bacterium]|nr:proteasome accessory factor [Gaiellaceae bacterium]MDX6488528.1 proteasome accessory factor [Gaiellaceae bacterium]MDX6508573.1 proteasome accessory factor [Gaiellaceae bacterium]MDX6517837.1 proteasome accessory factor [Gaiellaceae bacterium]MDX6543204.1 proteasome accessory factor [Gaiellaceae bacterium]